MKINTEMTFKDILQYDENIINNHINYKFNLIQSFQEKLYESMLYSLKAGGKRLRPIIFLETLKMFKIDEVKYLDIAIALEMIHTYSLIHDDLPAMDNDSLRRGKPTNHMVFGEAIAILAGDSLLNYAHEIMLEFLINNNDKNLINAIYEISKAAGPKGMIGGQILDIESENKQIDIYRMKNIHSLKTGALIEVSMTSAALISKASYDKYLIIKEYSKKIGLAFQITDDILDIIGDEKVLGKNVGSDFSKSKATYPKFYGIDKSIEIAKDTIDEATKLLDIFSYEEKFFFLELSDYIIKRTK